MLQDEIIKKKSKKILQGKKIAIKKRIRFDRKKNSRMMKLYI